VPVKAAVYICKYVPYCSLRGEEESTSYGAPVEPEDLSGHRRHGHMITNIINLPAKGHLKERYVTTGKDGTFRFWQAKVWLQNLKICSAYQLAAVAHGILLVMQHQQTVNQMFVLFIAKLYQHRPHATTLPNAVLSASLWLLALRCVLLTKDS